MEQVKKKTRKSRPGKRDRENARAAEQKEEEEDLSAAKEQKKQQQRTVPQWNFDVDYNDHFETPLQAYLDIVPFLKEEASKLGKALEDLVVYDPYYCQGGMVAMLRNELGIKTVINENVDFYHSIAGHKVPPHDILITNPPYSGEHKLKLLAFLRDRGRECPFALLLPAYCATKSYWREFVGEGGQQQSIRCMYIMPRDRYEFSHPEGTGKAVPPFYSCWFLGNCCSTKQILGTKCGHRVVLLDSLEEMGARNFVKTERRLNPKQRRKLKNFGAKKGGGDRT